METYTRWYLHYSAGRISLHRCRDVRRLAPVCNLDLEDVGSTVGQIKIALDVQRGRCGWDSDSAVCFHPARTKYSYTGKYDQQLPSGEHALCAAYAGILFVVAGSSRRIYEQAVDYGFDSASIPLPDTRSICIPLPPIDPASRTRPCRGWHAASI